MKLEEILDEWDKDSQMDLTDLSLEAASVSKLHAKYLRMYTTVHITLRKQEQNMSILKADKQDFYMKGETQETRNKGWVWPGKIFKGDLEIYMTKDTDVIALQEKIIIQKEKSELLESIIKMIMSRGYLIKNAVDWERFKSGG